MGATGESILMTLAETPKNKLTAFFTKENLFKIGGRLLVGCVFVVVLVFFRVVSWRISWSNWNVDLSKFEFSDLLALIMGLFAVAMSVAFYFKATDTSNKFYDNVYKFTQETSEILGRIEAGFGEKLRHLDEGYAGLQTRFDKFSFLTPEESIKKADKNKEREEEAKAEKKEATDEKQKLISHLLEKAKIDDEEKKQISSKLESLSAQYEKAEKRLSQLKAERDQMQHEMHLMERDMFRGGREIEEYLIDLFRHTEFRHFFRESEGEPFEIMRKSFGNYLRMVPRQVAMELQKQGILSEDGELTRAGYITLRNVYRRLRHNPEI
jgi:molecular chaperone GrpE (heat shock protein)